MNMDRCLRSCDQYPCPVHYPATAAVSRRGKSSSPGATLSVLLCQFILINMLIKFSRIIRELMKLRVLSFRIEFYRRTVINFHCGDMGISFRNWRNFNKLMDLQLCIFLHNLTIGFCQMRVKSL